MDTAYKLSYQIIMCSCPDYGVQDNRKIPKIHMWLYNYKTDSGSNCIRKIKLPFPFPE